MGEELNSWPLHAYLIKKITTLLIYNSYSIQFVHIKVQFNSFGTFTQLSDYHQKDIKTFLSAQREISYLLGFIFHFFPP